MVQAQFDQAKWEAYQPLINPIKECPFFGTILPMQPGITRSRWSEYVALVFLNSVLPGLSLPLPSLLLGLSDAWRFICSRHRCHVPFLFSFPRSRRFFSDNLSVWSKYRRERSKESMAFFTSKEWPLSFPPAYPQDRNEQRLEMPFCNILCRFPNATEAPLLSILDHHGIFSDPPSSQSIVGLSNYLSLETGWWSTMCRCAHKGCPGIDCHKSIQISAFSISNPRR